MTGGLMQLVACGAQDIFLTGSPMISYFKTVYRRHTNFAIETIKQKFDIAPGFGSTVTSTLTRNGDLVTGAYIQATLPDLTEKQTSNFELTANGLNSPTRRYVRWVDNIGHYLLKKVEISIGGSMIDRHYSDWFEIWTQLTVPASKMVGYRKMIGQDPKNIFGQNTGLQADVLASVRSDTDVEYPIQNSYIVGRDVFIPLQFWFCRNIGLALPLIALQYNDVRIHIEFRTAEDLILVWAGDTAQKDGKPIGWAPADDYNLYITHGSLAVNLWIDYVFLDADERRRFAQVSHEYLLEQLQYTEVTGKGDSICNVSMAFSHPVKELIWVAKAFESSKEWSNFTNTQLPVVPPFQTAAVDNNLLSGLTGLPDETYISASKLIVNIVTGNALFITGNFNIHTTGITNFQVTPAIAQGYSMLNGDVITVSGTRKIFNAGIETVAEVDNVTLIVSRSHNGIATEFLTRDILSKSATYNIVKSIVRVASVITNTKLSVNIRSSTAIAQYATFTSNGVGTGVFQVSPKDDYVMLYGDIIKLAPNGDETKLVVVTVAAATNGVATSFKTRNPILANTSYNTVISVIRPSSAVISTEQLQIEIQFKGAITQGAEFTMADLNGFIWVTAEVDDVSYIPQVGDIITAIFGNNQMFIYSIQITLLAADGSPSRFRALTNLNDPLTTVLDIVRPANETNGLAQLTANPSGLSNIKTYDELMNFCNYNSSRPYSSINGLAGCPVESAVLMINTNERFAERPGNYFSLVQTNMHHTNIPESPGIMCYSFALKPEEHQPSGACNFSRLDSAKLRIRIGKFYRENEVLTVTPTIKVFAINYNILRVVSGMGGLAYNS